MNASLKRHIETFEESPMPQENERKRIKRFCHDDPCLPGDVGYYHHQSQIDGVANVFRIPESSEFLSWSIPPIYSQRFCILGGDEGKCGSRIQECKGTIVLLAVSDDDLDDRTPDVR